MVIIQKVRKYFAANPKVSMIIEISPSRLRQGKTNLAELTQKRVFALGRIGLVHRLGRLGHQRFRLELLELGFTYSTRRKRSADQSSSIATMRTDSKPASWMTLHPESRLNSQA